MAVKIGTGFSSITSHNLMVTGVISSTVVTLSNSDDRNAVEKQRAIINGHNLPAVI